MKESSVKEKKKNPLKKILKDQAKSKTSKVPDALANGETKPASNRPKERIEGWDKLPIEQQMELMFSALPMSERAGEIVPNLSVTNVHDAVLPKLDKNTGFAKKH